MYAVKVMIEIMIALIVAFELHGNISMAALLTQIKSQNLMKFRIPEKNVSLCTVRQPLSLKIEPLRNRCYYFTFYSLVNKRLLFKSSSKT